MKQETLYRRILEAIETDKMVTNRLNLHSMDLKLSRAVKQLRQAGFIDGAFHDLADGSIMIEGLPIITIRGKRFLDELRSKSWQTAWRVVTIIWAIIIGLSGIISGIYYWLHLRS